MKLRIKFAKSGVMRFIGHLDVMRYFQKAIRRAEIDIAYSGGYSPHQIMSFAAPLGVGLTSNGEYMDIEVCSYTSSEDMKRRLNAVMVEGMEILNVTMLDENTPNAMASVAAAEYSLRFREGLEPPIDLVSQLDAFYALPTIPVIKKTKKSELELDLKPAIYSLSAEHDSDDRPVIRMLVDASSSGNIKPGMVMEAFYRANGEELSEFSLLITREDTYTYNPLAQEDKDAPRFIPLDAVGRMF